MAKEKSIVEDAILQMKNLEEAVAENAKGILASTMKEEISELVKESLSEQEEDDEVEMDAEMDVDMEDEDETDMEDSEEGSEMEMANMDADMGMDSEMEEPIDLSNESDEEVLRVFELMGPEDKLIVKKDGAGNINLKDTETNKEYMIVGEGEEEEEIDEEMDEEEMDEEMDEEMYEQTNMEEDMDEEDESIESIVDKVFGSDDYEEEDEDEDEIMYEVEMDEESDEEEMYEQSNEEEMYEESDEDEDEIMYEIEMDEEEDEEEMDETMMESKMVTKPKGMGMGKAKFSYKGKPNMEGGFKTVKKKADKTMGTGSAKKVKLYKDKTNMDSKNKVVKKMETKEASRTLGNGRNWGRKGLPKPKASPRHIRLESTDAELQILRQKNDEYRKALNVFRNKLNEVAVFNSNLAYATRLFTEHSTSKQEKINILRRFDTVESLKESKNLYKQIKDELGTSKTESINESMERVVTKTPSTGSAANLIESKTYENPQFLRMKDLMSKIK